MKVTAKIVGEHSQRVIGWPSDWPAPTEGQEVTLEDGVSIFVRTVVWYPMGDEVGGDLDPFMYLVLGPERT